MNRTRWWLSGLQAAVALVVVVLVARTVQRNWAEFRAVDVSIHPDPGWLALAALMVFVAYAFYIEAWRRLLAGWGQRIRYVAAARVWTVANLGRYLPGKIWSVCAVTL